MAAQTAPNRVQAEIEFIAQGLASGESSRGICPKCLGGSSGEKSFLMSRDTSGIAHYICFRATCGHRGRVDALLGPKSDGVIPKRTYALNRPLRALDAKQIQWYRDKFDINPGREVYWCPELERFAYSVLGPQGQHRGWLLRSYDSSLSPKAIAYPSKEREPFIGWFIEEQKGHYPVIVVEDLVSARKVSDAGFRSVSLNGTNNMDFEVIYEILGETKDIVLALDQGTLGLMMKYRTKYELLFDDIIIWQLKEDLKYVPRKRIREAVIDGRTDFIGDSKLTE